MSVLFDQDKPVTIEDELKVLHNRLSFLEAIGNEECIKAVNIVRMQIRALSHAPLRMVIEDD